MESRREDLLGPAAARYSPFPWLIKFLDAHDWLSVQVHPDEHAVKRLWPGERSKTEAWFVLDSLPGSRIYAGLLPGVDEKELRSALHRDRVAECLNGFEPHPGDCVFLPAGTVHAVGGGLLMAEVQQTSDATFRIFDWNRRDAQGNTRTLHIEEALACIDWNQGPVMPVRACGFADRFGGGGVIKAGPEQSHPLVRCEYFHLDYLSSGEPFACGGSGRLQALVVLAGRGRLTWDSREAPLSAGQVWLLPAKAPAAHCVPDQPLAAMFCTLP
jgi:mannose-6-phosphate isomerase